MYGPKNTNENEYTSNLQQAIDKTSAKGTTIRKLQKLLGKLLKIHCDNEDGAQQLRKIECEKAITPRVTLASQEYRVILHGVPINVLDARPASQQDMQELIQKTNNNIEV